MLPTFLGIGAPKAGTTFLYNRLREHPDVFMSSIKEPCYFDFRYTYKDRMWYQRQFDGAEEYTAVGEFSTRYLKSEEAPARVRSDIPEVQLIVSLRNPVEQVYSHYWHLQRQNFHQPDLDHVPETFEEALRRFPEKLLGPARYAHNLRRWLKHFNRERIRILFFRDLKQKPDAVLRELYSFLGVDPLQDEVIDREHGSSDRRGTSPRHPVLQRVHAATYKYLNHWVYAPLKRLIGVEWATTLKERLRVREVLEGLFRKEGYPEMQEETRSRLRAYFADDIERLEDITGRDFQHWR